MKLNPLEFSTERINVQLMLAESLLDEQYDMTGTLYQII